MPDTPPPNPVVKVTHIPDTQERAATSLSAPDVVIHIYRVQVNKICSPAVAFTANDGTTAIPLKGSALDGFPAMRAGSIEVQRDPQAKEKFFLVTVTYSPIPAAPSEPGAKWSLDISVRGVPYSEPVYHDVDHKPILNSANKRYPDVTLEREWYDEEITVSFNAWSIDLANISACRGKVNENDIAVNINGYVRTFAAGTLKLQTADYKSTYKSTGGVADALSAYWGVNYVFVSRTGGWKRKVIDHGIDTLDGNTGKTSPILDPVTQQQITTPVLLDGRGHKLADGSPAVFFPTDGYQLEETTSFAGLFTDSAAEEEANGIRWQQARSVQPRYAQRIADAVRAVEGQATPNSRPGRGAGLIGSFWARITAPSYRIFGDEETPDSIVPFDSASGDEPFYDWIRVQPNSEGQMVPMPDITGEANARNVNGKGWTYGGGVMPQGTTVKLFLIGYNPRGDVPLYAFTSDADKRDDWQSVPPHDHRNNMPGFGGFAFSVYAPGTSVPQMDWNI